MGTETTRVEVDDHQEVGATRAEMKALEQKAHEFREFCRVHRRGIYADLPVEDAEVVDVSERRAASGTRRQKRSLYSPCTKKSNCSLTSRAVRRR